MTDRRDPGSPEADLSALELAFGLLDGSDLAAAEARAARDPAFAAEVARWQERALALFDRDAAEPDPGLWSAIAARLPANDDGRAVVNRWRWATGVSLAAALVLGVFALRPAPAPAPTPVAVAPAAHPLVALLRAPGQAGSLAVSIEPGGHGFTTTPAALDLPGHAAELWVIPAGGVPRSLGVVPAGPEWHRVPGPLAATLVAGATLAITVEPVGGSPNGKPSGAPILAAKISAT